MRRDRSLSTLCQQFYNASASPWITKSWEARLRRGAKNRKLTVVQSLALLQEGAMRITSENGLGLEESAQAGAMATAFIVKECAKSIGGEVGFNVAAFGFIEGCKTAPPALEPVQKSAVEKKP